MSRITVLREQLEQYEFAAASMEGARIFQDDNLRRYCLSSGWSNIAAVGHGGSQ
jgi:hypothetical protein